MAGFVLVLGFAVLLLLASVLGESSKDNAMVKNSSDNPKVDKAWMGRQGQILSLLNSIQNCRYLNETNFTILDHLPEYSNSSRVKNYVEGGFQDVEQLFEIFWTNWNNSELIYKTGIHLIQSNIDPVEFFYGLGSVVVNKPGGYQVPPAYDIFSEMILGPSEDELGVDDIHKGLSLKPGVDYYLEDPGLRSFYMSWFLHNPLWWKDKEYNVTKERTGELFLYIVHQLYARYNAARIVERDLKELNDFKFGTDDDPFVNEIDTKLRDMVWHAGPEPNMANPLDAVGKLILKLFPSQKNYFMELLNIAEKDSKTGKSLQSFYTVLKYIETFAHGAREKLVDNRYNEADFHFDGVTLESLKVIYKSKNKPTPKDNTFYTHWNYRKYYVKKCDKTVTIEKRILDHTEFFYELQIESLLDNRTDARVDIFLSPKFDFDGKPLLPNEYQKYMFHQDQFEIVLKPGENKFRRSSKMSSLSSAGDASHVKQIQQLISAEAGYHQLSVPNRKHTHCGLPSNLMIPKGGKNNRPLKFILLALVTPSTSTGNDDPFTLCGFNGGNSDTRAFGFPFDRGMVPDNLLEEVKTAKKITVQGIMSGEDEYSEDL